MKEKDARKALKDVRGVEDVILKARLTLEVELGSFYRKPQEAQNAATAVLEALGLTLKGKMKVDQ